jgi:hypothetical protein
VTICNDMTHLWRMQVKIIDFGAAVDMQVSH